MPTYEYKCPKCGTEFEEFQRITARPGAKCPKCGSKAQRQMSAGAGLVFKGSGFYLTDYGRSGQKAKQESESSSGGEKPGGEKSGGEKSGGEKSGGEKSGSEKPSSAKSGGEKASESKPAAEKPAAKPKKKDD